MANNDNWLMLVVIGGAVYLLMVRPSAVAPYSAQKVGGQFGVNIPGYGQYQSGPGGTFLQFDPKLFQGLFGGGAAAAPAQDALGGVPVEYDPCWSDPMGCLPDDLWSDFYG